MKVSDRFHKGPVQDLLNAVVVQAAEDYREYSAKLIVKPGSRQAAKDLEEVKSFFLSEDFCFYTKVGGDYILKKLNEELSGFENAYEVYRQTEADLQQEARNYARLLLQKQKCESDAAAIEKEFPDAENKVHVLIRNLREQQIKMPEYARKLVKYPKFDTVMVLATEQLKEDILNGKESLWG